MRARDSDDYKTIRGSPLYTFLFSFREEFPHPVWNTINLNLPKYIHRVLQCRVIPAKVLTSALDVRSILSASSDTMKSPRTPFLRRRNKNLIIQEYGCSLL